MKKKNPQKRRSRTSQRASIHVPISTVTRAIERQTNVNGSRGSVQAIPSFRPLDSPKLRLEGTPRGPSISVPNGRGNGSGRSPSSFLELEYNSKQGLKSVPEEQPPPPTVNKYEELEYKIELYFSKIIPALFVLFNFAYWPWLLQNAEYYNDKEFKATHFAE